MTVSLPVKPLPVGFRFQPTDEELVNHYLKGKITGRASASADVAFIPEIDVCKCEPWDLPEKSPIKTNDQEWFFFASRDWKNSSKHRSNRATQAGFWKATGKDREIWSKAPNGRRGTLIGMKKTLVFHCGRAPKGERTGWIMHEYRTTEAEFESRYQASYILYRLFNKEVEKDTHSDEDEKDQSDISPMLGSPSTRVQDDVQSIEAVGTPLDDDWQHPGLLPTQAKLSKNHLKDLQIEQMGITSAFPMQSGATLGFDHQEERPISQVVPLAETSKAYDGDNQDILHGLGNICSPMRPYTDHPFLGFPQQETVALSDADKTCQDLVDLYFSPDNLLGVSTQTNESTSVQFPDHVISYGEESWEDGSLTRNSVTKGSKDVNFWSSEQDGTPHMLLEMSASMNQQQEGFGNADDLDGIGIKVCVREEEKLDQDLGHSPQGSAARRIRLKNLTVNELLSAADSVTSSVGDKCDLKAIKSTSDDSFECVDESTGDSAASCLENAESAGRTTDSEVFSSLSKSGKPQSQPNVLRAPPFSPSCDNYVHQDRTNGTEVRSMPGESAAVGAKDDVGQLDDIDEVSSSGSRPQVLRQRKKVGINEDIPDCLVLPRVGGNFGSMSKNAIFAAISLLLFCAGLWRALMSSSSQS